MATNYSDSYREISANKAGSFQRDVGMWQRIRALLIAKTHGSKIPIANFRPITIILVICKLYMICLISLCSGYLAIQGHLAYGARAGYSAIELIFILRIILE